MWKPRTEEAAAAEARARRREDCSAPSSASAAERAERRAARLAAFLFARSMLAASSEAASMGLGAKGRSKLLAVRYKQLLWASLARPGRLQNRQARRCQHNIHPESDFRTQIIRDR